MAESLQGGLSPTSDLLEPPRDIVNRLELKYGGFLSQIIDCFIVVMDSFYPPYNFLVQQSNEQEYCSKVKMWSEPWQRALQLGRANCQRCSPFGRLLIQSCSISGSQAEQLTTDAMDWPVQSSSDEDLMVVLGPVQWVSVESETGGTTRTTETTGATDNAGTPRLTIAPTGNRGFVRVLQERQSDCPHPETLPFPAEDVRQFFKELMLAVQPRAELSVNGPATSYVKPQFFDAPPEHRHQSCGVPEVDRVPCLHVPFWPSEEFFTRCRESGWPPAAAQEDMKRFGVHLVPVGAPGSVTERYEWRWSFSRAEVVTAMHLAPVPRCALKTVKACKRVASLQGKSLKSYYIKTAVFWLCQAEGGQHWESVSQGVLQILDYLEKAVTTKQLSCFYWRDINILELTKRDERRATLRTINHIRRRMKSLMIQAFWPLLMPLLMEPQPRLSERQMRVVLVRYLIRFGVEMSSSMYYLFAVACRFDWKIPFPALSSNAAEVCSMFRQLTTPWCLRSFLLHALIMAPQEVASQLRLTASEGGGFVWNADPLIALLTEGDLKELLGDPDAVRAWLRHQLPEAERQAGLPADLRSPRDFCDLLLNIPLLVSVLIQSVPKYRQEMDDKTERTCPPRPERYWLSFEAARQRAVEEAVGWFSNSLLFHTRLGVERELSLRRVLHYMVLLSQFCGDPATRAEHDRLRNVMPDSWQLRQVVFGGAV